jgi:hypothetical protein
MPDLHVRSDSVDVEQIMKQIRTRIREKRGSDYTEAELQQLASVKLEQFADPSGLRSDLLEQFRQRSNEPSTYHRHRGPRRWLLMLLHPLLKRIQKQLMADLNLYFEIIHNLVVETTRLGIETQNLKMKVESLSSRLDFDERRSRALEGAVQYRPEAMPRQRQPEQPRQQEPPRQPRPHPQFIPHAPSPAPVAAPSVTPTAPVTASPVATTAQVAPAFADASASAQASADRTAGRPAGPNGPTAPNGPGGPNGSNVRPDGKRRRRRRRRRPGQTLAESPLAGGNQATQGTAPTSNGQDSDDADGPDDDGGAPDQ